MNTKMERRHNRCRLGAGLFALVGTGLLAGQTLGEYSGPPSQWQTQDGGNGHWYMHHTFDAPTHVLDAQAWAEARGGYVSSVRSTVENNWIWETFGNSTLGGYQDFDAPDFSEPGGGWRWANGEPWDYSNWLPGEPSNSNGNEHGVAVCCPPMMRWNDVQIYNGTYLIEFDADCNGDGLVDYGQILDGSLADTNANGVPDVCESTGIITVCASGCDYTDIQSAVDASIDGDEIRIYQGVYTGAGDAVVSMPAHAITLKGMELDADGTPLAVVDGLGVRRGLSMTHESESIQVLSGLLIRNGYASQGNGGGALLAGGRPQLHNCHFIGNDVTGISGPGNGAGLYASTERVELTECVFRDNMAQRWGGGLGLFGVSEASLDSCVFASCHADNGGAMFTEQGTVVLVGCVVEDNSASDDVGGVYQEGGAITVSDCTFTGNTSGDDGGGLYASNAIITVTDSRFVANMVPEDGAGLEVRDSQLQLSNSVFDDNDASQGAGLMAVRSDVDIRTCQFTANKALISSSNEEMAGGAIEFHSCPSMYVFDCRFTANEAHDGGALCLQNPFNEPVPSFNIVECEFESNVVAGKGGAIYIGSNFGLIQGCGFRDNDASIQGRAIFAADGGGGFHLEYVDSTFCGSGLQPIETNDPGMLVDGGGNVIDVECDSCDADVSEDGEVSVNDLLVVIAMWGTNGPIGDVDGDGAVNVQDLLLVIQAWGTCG